MTRPWDNVPTHFEPICDWSASPSHQVFVPRRNSFGSPVAPPSSWIASQRHQWTTRKWPDAPLSTWPNWCPSLLTAKDPGNDREASTLCVKIISFDFQGWKLDPNMMANGTGCNWMQLMFCKNLQWKLSIEKSFSKSLATSRLLWNWELPAVGFASSSDQLGLDVMHQTQGPNNSHSFWRPMAIAAASQICESCKQILSRCF